MQAIAEFRTRNPLCVVTIDASEDLARLEYGEAHVAIRAGRAPEDLDNVVQPFVTMRQALYASPEYIDRMGRPRTEADLSQHQFVVHDDLNNRAPFFRWLHASVPAECLGFRCTDGMTMTAAIEAGVGLGFMSQFQAAQHPDLIEVMPPRPEWEAASWLVTHVDLHRTAKVQAFLTALKTATASWT